MNISKDNTDRDYANNIILYDDIYTTNGDFKLIRTFYGSDDLDVDDLDIATGANIVLQAVNVDPATRYILKAVYSYLEQAGEDTNLCIDESFISVDDYSDINNTDNICDKIRAIIEVLEV